MRYSAALQIFPSDGESSGGKIVCDMANPSGSESFMRRAMSLGASSMKISTGSFNATTPAGNSGPKEIFARGVKPCVIERVSPAREAERENICARAI